MLSEQRQRNATTATPSFYDDLDWASMAKGGGGNGRKSAAAAQLSSKSAHQLRLPEDHQLPFSDSMQTMSNGSTALDEDGVGWVPENAVDATVAGAGGALDAGEMNTEVLVQILSDHEVDLWLAIICQ